jgi:hypothetical protein
MKRPIIEREILEMLVWLIATVLTLVLVSTLMSSCTQQTTCTTQSPQYCEADTLVVSDTITTSLEWTPLFPVPIVSVTRVSVDGYKWEVLSENGVVFYSNKKYKVGDVAFYMDGDSEKLYWTKK